jgi:hypothetical protein
VLGIRLIGALWDGQAPRLTHASIVVAAVLVAASILSLPRSNDDLTLVAAVTSPLPVAADATELNAFTVSESRVRLAGSRFDDSHVWAVIEDPRTGSLWLQGPALETNGAWTLDLVLGTDASAVSSLRYRVSILRVDSSINDGWLDASERGILTLPMLPPGQTWIARDREVTIGS